MTRKPNLKMLNPLTVPRVAQSISGYVPYGQELSEWLRFSNVINIPDTCRSVFTCLPHILPTTFHHSLCLCFALATYPTCRDQLVTTRSQRDTMSNGRIPSRLNLRHYLRPSQSMLMTPGYKCSDVAVLCRCVQSPSSVSAVRVECSIAGRRSLVEELCSSGLTGADI